METQTAAGPIYRTVAVSLRDNEIAGIDELVTQTGMSRSSLIRIAIQRLITTKEPITIIPGKEARRRRPQPDVRKRA